MTGYEIFNARVEPRALASYLEDAIPGEELLAFDPGDPTGASLFLYRGVRHGSMEFPRVGSWTDDGEEARLWATPGGRVVRRSIDLSRVIALVAHHDTGTIEYVVATPEGETR